MNKSELLKPFKKVAVEQQKFEDYIKEIRPDLKRAFKEKLAQIPTATITKQGRKVKVIDGRNKDYRAFVLRLPNLLKDALKEIGYTANAYKFVANFDDIETATMDILQAQNGEKLSAKKVAEWRDFMETQTLSYLAGDALADEVLVDIKKALSGAALGQTSYFDAVDVVGDLLAGGADTAGAFSRVATLTVRDSVYQYNGVLNEEASRQFGYNAFRYVGSIVDETRAQCERWAEMEYLLYSELESEIEWAFENGSGMNPMTTADNFSIYRGGRNCRHIAVPTFYEPEE